jgi:hypothetical protein
MVTAMDDRVYPLPRPQASEKFTFGLILDVGAVLVKHGYPKPESGGDFARLQQALFGFLYGTTEEAGR